MRGVELSVDTGLRGCGTSLFDVRTHELVRAAYVENPSTGGNLALTVREMARAVARWAMGRTEGLRVEGVCLEVMRVYQGSKQEGDPNDLINLSLVGGAILGLFPDALVHHYYPHEWKGGEPKHVTQRRIREKLTPEELFRIELPRRVSLAHNAWDAVGIGLKSAGRFERVRVITR